MSTATTNAAAPAACDWGEALDLTVLSPREQEFVTFIDRTIIGQKRGRRAAQRAFRRTLSKLRMGTAPIYAILALGPTTCGKSELAYRLAEFLHGDREALLKIDGSEYMDDSRLTKLVGGTAQWVGFVDKNRADYVPPKADEKDPMCEFNNHNLAYSRKGSANPVSVVLIDEWDKACKEFNNIMLSILRTGKYTLGNGEVVDFRNTIFIFTANLGARDVEKEKAKALNPLGFRNGEELTAEQVEELFSKHLKEFTAPEFRARIVENGEVVVFDALTSEQIGLVRDLKVEDMTAFIRKVAGLRITVDEAARKRLLELSLVDNGTVANLNGVLATQITDNIDNLLIVESISAKDVVLVTVGEDGKTLEIRPSAKVVLLTASGLDDPEFLAATAEADAQMQAASGGKRRGGEEVVDQEALRRTAEEAKRAAAEAQKVRQPFTVRIVTSAETHAGVMAELDGQFKTFKVRKLSANTQYGVTMQTNVGIIVGDLTIISVSADIRDIVKLVEAVPGLMVHTVESAVG